MDVRLRKRRGTPAVDRSALVRAARLLLEELGLRQAELSILLTDDREMRALNLEYRGRDRATDVLSFSQLEGPAGGLPPGLLGDVVLSVETAARQARARRVSLEEELGGLLVHGILHLAGFDHVGVPAARARRMRAEQARLEARLRSFGRRATGGRAP